MNRPSETHEALLTDDAVFAASFLKSPIPQSITTLEDGRYVSVNDAFAKLWGIRRGRTREELLQKTSISSGILTVEKRAQMLKEYREKGVVENFEIQTRTKDGELRYGLFNISKITLNSEDYFLTTYTDITDRKSAELERERLIAELRQALSDIKTLSGLLPICSACKKIRDDKGYWNQIESYISDHSEAEFSHGICPDCAKKLYPDAYKRHSRKVSKPEN